jgi:uncharacterized protein (TIGR00303 family)
MIKNITGRNKFINSLQNKNATFLLALSSTQTDEIDGITQAGIPGLIHLTPTLDAEFVATKEVKSLGEVASTPKGVPTPALITRAIHELSSFSNLEFLELGIDKSPEIKDHKRHLFDISRSGSIDTPKIGANIDAKTILEKGVEFAKRYKCTDDYIILGESTPSGTTTAQATALALGYDTIDKFSSSFKQKPTDIKAKVIQKSLNNLSDSDDTFSKLSKVSDNMLIFSAGFMAEISKTTKIILAGGTQFASSLLILNSLINQNILKANTSNIALCTTKWVVKDSNSDIKALLKMLDFDISSYYSDFDFSLAKHPALKLYDEGEAKEGVGAGGALVYGALKNLSHDEITTKVESFL